MLGKGKGVHTFTETVNGGMLGISSATRLGTGVWVFQLTDFPIFQKFNTCFEFVRLNKITIEYWPKFNMQLNQGSVVADNSMSGTFITAVDQVPFNIVVGTTTAAANWVDDSSSSSGTTDATPYESASITPGYVRGLEGSKECELYKKQTTSFYPAFYDFVVQGSAGDRKCFW